MKGFTLLEVMVALAIIAGVLMTVLSSFSHHLGIASSDRDETVAMLLARSKLDDSRLKGEMAGTGTFAPEWPGISWQLASEPAAWPGIERLILTVSWDSGAHRLSLAHYREKAI